ncbi:hypothetical protein TNCV_285281 [Trichonephila clavipes]|nr:hypothetical protein TNCV_285281 [Trichonephila clavipes]
MIRKFEATRTLWIQLGRGRKCAAVQVLDRVATQVEEDRSKTNCNTSVRSFAASVDLPYFTVHKILRKALYYYSYKPVIPKVVHDDLQGVHARRCGKTATTFFMQDGALPHIARCAKQVLHHHFSDDRIISRHFPTA